MPQKMRPLSLHFEWRRKGYGFYLDRWAAICCKMPEKFILILVNRFRIPFGARLLGAIPF
jgi:hypothetical protein